MLRPQNRPRGCGSRCGKAAVRAGSSGSARPLFRGLSAAGESLQNGGVQLGFVLFHGDSHRDLCFYRLESQNGEVCCALCVVSSLVFNCDTNTEVQESSYLCSKDLPATPDFFFSPRLNKCEPRFFIAVPLKLFVIAGSLPPKPYPNADSHIQLHKADFPPHSYKYCGMG